MKNNPLISVCVPTYKRPRTLEQLIISFIAQPYEAAELFIVDDAPIPETQTMIAKYKILCHCEPFEEGCGNLT